MMSGKDAEIEVLQNELKWLLAEEVNPILQDIKTTLKECYDCLPFMGTLEKSASHNQLHPQRILLNNPNSQNQHFKAVVTLRGDCVEDADIQFKHKQGKEHNLFRTRIKQGSVWKLSQIHDAGNHLCEALEVVSQHDSQHQFKTVKEVFMVLESLMDRLMQCRQSLCMPKRKNLEELLKNKNLLIFSPPLPSDIAMSFYIHASKVVLALYSLHSDGSQRVEVSQRLQVESLVKWLNEALVFFTLSLQQCQQLKDKLTAVSQFLNAH